MLIKERINKKNEKKSSTVQPYYFNFIPNFDKNTKNLYEIQYCGQMVLRFYGIYIYYLVYWIYYTKSFY